jgi:plasmid stability protein
MACLHFAVNGLHDAVMSVQITIRDVPDAVRDELAARAALQGKSMQEYLRAELERLAARVPVEKVLERIRERKATAGTRLLPEEILAHRDTDRR